MRFNFWTLLFQTINFVILLVILKRVLYKPVRAIMEERRRLTAEAMQKAEAERKEAAVLKDRYQADLEGIEKEKTRLLAELQHDADAERTRLLAKAQEEANGIAAREKALREAEQRTIEAAFREQAVATVSLYATRLLRDLADEGLHAAIFRKFLSGLEEAISEIAIAGEEKVRVELAVAAALTQAEVEQVAGIIRSKTGKEVVIEITRDPALIAGVRMRLGDQVLDSSLAGQVQALRERLQQGTGTG